MNKVITEEQLKRIKNIRLIKEYGKEISYKDLYKKLEINEKSKHFLNYKDMKNNLYFYNDLQKEIIGIEPKKTEYTQHLGSTMNSGVGLEADILEALEGKK